jgi:hypothetical protein
MELRPPRHGLRRPICLESETRANEEQATALLTTITSKTESIAVPACKSEQNLSVPQSLASARGTIHPTSISDRLPHPMTLTLQNGSTPKAEPDALAYHICQRHRRRPRTTRDNDSGTRTAMVYRRNPCIKLLQSIGHRQIGQPIAMSKDVATNRDHSRPTQIDLRQSASREATLFNTPQSNWPSHAATYSKIKTGMPGASTHAPIQLGRTTSLESREKSNSYNTSAALARGKPRLTVSSTIGLKYHGNIMH